MFQINALSVEDIPALLRIEKHAFAQPWSHNSFREILEGSAFQSLGIRIRGGRLVAYIIFSEVSDELHILNLAVDTQYCRKGLASSLLEKVHREAFGRQAKIAYLEVRQDNRAAQGLYRKHGYSPVGHRIDYYPGEHEDAVVMAARLGIRPKKNS